MRVVIARENDVAPGALLGVEVDAFPVCLAHTEAGLYAINGNCTHEDCPLSEGGLEEFAVECPCHGSRFDVRTGEALNLPAIDPVATYPLEIIDGEVVITLPPS